MGEGRVRVRRRPLLPAFSRKGRRSPQTRNVSTQGMTSKYAGFTLAVKSPIIDAELSALSTLLKGLA